MAVSIASPQQVTYAIRRQLTDRIRRFALDNDADLMGVAPVARFEGAPRGHHPSDFLPDCRSVVVFGARILDRGLDHPRLMPNGSEFLPDEHLRDVMQYYFWEIQSHGTTSDLLSMLAFRAALMLQRAGHGSVYFRSSNGDRYGEKLHGRMRENTAIFSHRHAAVRAGLGEFGLDNVVVTPEYGQRVRWVSLLTTAELEPTPLLREKVCLGASCGLCLAHCEHLGVLTLLPEAESDEVWLNPVGVTDKALCVRTSATNRCKGQCIAGCPIGERV